MLVIRAQANANLRRRRRKRVNWFAAASFNAASLRMEHPTADVLVALLDKTTYRALLGPWAWPFDCSELVFCW